MEMVIILEIGYMFDHAKAIDLVYHKAKNRETFTIGGFNEWKNIDLVVLSS